MLMQWQSSCTRYTTTVALSRLTAGKGDSRPQKRRTTGRPSKLERESNLDIVPIGWTWADIASMQPHPMALVFGDPAALRPEAPYPARPATGAWWRTAGFGAVGAVLQVFPTLLPHAKKRSYGKGADRQVQRTARHRSYRDLHSSTEQATSDDVHPSAPTGCLRLVTPCHAPNAVSTCRRCGPDASAPCSVINCSRTGPGQRPSDLISSGRDPSIVDIFPAAALTLTIVLAIFI